MRTHWIAGGETVIMKIGGWKTASVFRRYDITTTEDLADAAARLDTKQKSHGIPEIPFGQSSGRVGENSTKNEAAPRLENRAALRLN